ncbi:MAG: 3'-5' exonuclease [Chitinophagales bacterium]
MLNHLQFENLICLDIETVPGAPDFNLVPEALKELYLKKSERLKAADETPEQQYFNHAGIYAEFGKVICISLGMFQKEKETGEWHFRLKSIYGDDEKKLLQEFAALLQHSRHPNRFQFCGHNIREFDVPYLCRRMLLRGIPLPAILDISGKKPYEVSMLDTMQLWRFGDYKHFTSLKLLAALFNIASPKDDIEGKDVGRVYWMEKDLIRIVNYCQKDVVTVAQLVLRFKGMPLLKAENIQLEDS